MSDSSPIADTFQAIVNRAENVPSGTISGDGDVASSAYTATLTQTILPRRVTLCAADGSRLSVIARNRKVIRVEDVQPRDLWTGDADPDATDCSADFDAFAKDFAGSIVAICARGAATTETSLISEDVKSTALAGYAASHLPDHLAQVRSLGAKEILPDFYDAWDGHARARAGKETAVDLPTEPPVHARWLQSRLAEWSNACKGDGLQLRFITTTGEQPIAIAFAALDDDRCVIVTDKPDDFAKLEAALGALRGHF